jgi:hypothetical protein
LAAISTHYTHFGVVLQPFGDLVSRTVIKESNRPTRIKINNDRSILMGFSLGPIIDADVWGRSRWGGRGTAYEREQQVNTSRQCKVSGEAGASGTSEGESDVLLSKRETLGTSATRSNN